MADKLYYLASPYSHTNRRVKKIRSARAMKAAVKLFQNGIFTFAPIPYNSPWERYCLPGDWTFWEKFDKLFVSRMDGVIVLMLPGWDKSIGVRAEIKYAKRLGKPVYYATPQQIEKGDFSFLKDGIYNKKQKKE